MRRPSSGGRRGRMSATPRSAAVWQLAALAALVAVLVGVPLWLSAIGGSTFLHLDPRVLWRAAVDPRSADTGAVVTWLGRLALAIAWLTWAWTAVCLSLEVRGWISGRRPKRLPASRNLQWMAACLVGTAFALGGVGRSPMHVHPVGIHATGRADVVSTVRSTVKEPGSPVSGDRSSQSGPVATAASPSGIAAPASTPWSSVSDADVVVDDAPTRDGSARPVIAGYRRHPVSPRETLWSVAESRLGSARRWREVADLNYGRVQPDGGHLTDDHWIRPGWELLLPAVDPGTALLGVADPPAERRADRGSGEAAVPDVTPTPDTLATRGTPVAPGAPFQPIAPIAPVGAGIVGVGMSDLVDRMRKVQQRHRRSGSRIRLPEPLLRQFEQRLRSGSGGDSLSAVEDAVRLFHRDLDPGVEPPRIIAVTVSDVDVRLVLADQGLLPPASPHSTQNGGRPEYVIARGELELAGVESPGRRRATYPLPTLVSVGRNDERLVMVHPEGVGSLAVEGTREDAEGLARAMALELATSRWAEHFDLVLVGFGADLSRFARVTVVDGVGPLAADLSWRSLQAGVALEEVDAVSLVDARSRDTAVGGRSDHVWDPVVVICGPDVPPSAARTLIEIAGDGTRGIAVVIAGPTGGAPGSARDQVRAAHVVHARGGALDGTVDAVGEIVEVQRIDPQELGQACALLDVAGIVDDQHAEDDRSEGTVGFDHHARGTIARVGARRVGSEVGADVGPPLHGDHDGDCDRSLHDSGPALELGADPASPPDQSIRTAAHGESLRAPGRPSGRPAGIPVPGVEVEIAVLGPVEIHGAARAFTRAWSRELVVYLAMHPTGAANESWATALWPERLMAPSSLHSTASVARRALGKARDGSDHLPRGHGRLELAPSVGTDWDRFLALAEAVGEDEDIERWRQALALVRGRPFEGLRATDWAILDGTLPMIESTIVDLSGRLAGASLRVGDAAGAEWAARRGLRVSPYDERLYRMLLRAADAAGNPSGVESVMAELVRVVTDEIEPVESVHPSTLALYRSLSRRKIPTP